MTQKFNPTTWIDEQRQAGASARNVFTDILAAAESIRRGQTKKADYRVEARAVQVEQIRSAAAVHDAQVAGGDPDVPSFGQMVSRWKRGAP